MEALGKMAGAALDHLSDRAFRWGYEDGFYGDAGENFTGNLRLASLEDPAERLDYYRGHRAGSRSRFAHAVSAA